MVGRHTVVFDQRRVPAQGCGERVLAVGSRSIEEGCRVVTLMLVAGHRRDCAGCDCLDWVQWVWDVVVVMERSGGVQLDAQVLVLSRGFPASVLPIPPFYHPLPAVYALRIVSYSSRSSFRCIYKSDSYIQEDGPGKKSKDVLRRLH